MPRTRSRDRIVLLFCLLVVPTAEALPLYRAGAAATAHPAASAAALRMLERGGTAADAAVAAAFTLAVVGPYHSGIGGGGVAVVFDAQREETRALDFREVAPRAATSSMFLRDGRAVPALSRDGALSVAVPSAAVGYLDLHARHGRLDRAVVLGPAIQAARRGFRVTPKYRALASERRDCVLADPEAARLFLGPDGEVPPVGFLIRQPELARTLEAIAASGARAMTHGRVARAIVSSVRAAGGVLALEDLSAVESRWLAPLEGTYRGHSIATMPLPSAGGIAVLQVLAVLEAQGPDGLSSRRPEVLHVYVEALRRVFLERSRSLGDSRFVPDATARLLSPEFLRGLREDIDPARAARSVSLAGGADGGRASRPASAADGGEKRNTTHISVIDARGNAVALTTTLNYGFGSCLVAKGTGVLLNDQMDDFAAAPEVPNAYGLVGGAANAVAPGKKPLSSMSPTIVFARGEVNRVRLVVGSPGGSTIPTTVVQVISNVLDGGMDVARAVAHGRLHHQYLPDEIRVDRYALEPATRARLEALGHVLRDVESWGDAEAVAADPLTGLFTAGSDPRNEGAAVGLD